MNFNPVIQKTAYTLGSETVHLVTTQWKETGIVYINVHENEQTSVTAGKATLSVTGGTLIELKAQGNRLISFQHNGTTYTFDPNRMFSTAGIQNTLAENGPCDALAADIIAGFAKAVTIQLLAHKPRLVVALHNTTGDYAVDNYIPGGIYEHEGAGVFVNTARHRGDFFFTTGSHFFEQIKNAGYNVVLQNNDTVADDGSLSVYCRRNVPYINIEAMHGHLQEQKEMLAFVNTGLKY